MSGDMIGLMQDAGEFEWVQDVDGRCIQLSGSGEAEIGVAVMGDLPVPGGARDYITVGVVRNDRGIPDVGDLARHLDRDLPGRRGAVIVHRDIGVEAAAPGIGSREVAAEVSGGSGWRRDRWRYRRRHWRRVVIDDGRRTGGVRDGG